jgi:hypothetical protein
VTEDVLVDGISDAERDRVVRELTRHCGDGRLTLDELEERISIAAAATTRAELDALFEDLPTGPPAPATPTAPIASASTSTPTSTPAPRVPSAQASVPAPVRRTRQPKLPQSPVHQTIGTLLVIGGFVALFNGLFLLAILCWVAPGLLLERR